jgi:hypothetical protein
MQGLHRSQAILYLIYTISSLLHHSVLLSTYFVFNQVAAYYACLQVRVASYKWVQGAFQLCCFTFQQWDVTSGVLLHVRNLEQWWLLPAMRRFVVT